MTEIQTVTMRMKKSKETFLADRVKLRNNILQQLISKFKFFDTKFDNECLVKKSVRVDSDIYNALCRITHQNKTFFTKIINTAILNEISTRQFDIIYTERFKHKITVYFSQKEYYQVQQILLRLKKIGLYNLTFSKLVRSILYKHFDVVSLVRKN